MNKKLLVLLFISLGSCMNIVFGVNYNNVSSYQTNCQGGTWNVNFYIPTSQSNMVIYPIDSFSNNVLSFIRNTESTVDIWRNNSESIGSNTCNNWYRGSNVAPGDGNMYYVIGSAGCTLNKVFRNDISKPDAQLVYKVAYKTEIGRENYLSPDSYMYRRYDYNTANLGALQYLSDQTMRKWSGLKIHSNECFNIYNHWCGDGVLDTYYGEQCEPSLTPGCSIICTLSSISSSSTSTSSSSSTSTSSSSTSTSSSSSTSTSSSGGPPTSSSSSTSTSSSGGTTTSSSGGRPPTSSSSSTSTSSSGGGFADSPDCQYIDPPSINLNEYLPMWWKLKDGIWTDTCNNDNIGKYSKSGTTCHFRVRNAIGQEDTFSSNCFNSNWSNLANGYIADRGSMSNYDGRTQYLVSSNKFSGLGETKIELYKVEYQRCESRYSWQMTEYNFEGGTYDGTVCAMNIFLTRPYIFQKGSTLSTVDNDLLSNFYTMNGSRIISANELKNITVTTYTGGNNMSFILNSFLNKYNTLAVQNVSYLSTHGLYNLKKVSNQRVYVYDGSTTIASSSSFTQPTTIIVKNGDLTINDDLSGPGMYIVPNGKIYFKTNNCDTQQKVEGIFIAQSFDTDNVLNYNLSSSSWCYDGRLVIKGVIKSIQSSISNIWSKRRSVVNNYFGSGETKEKIYNGASAFVGANPSLWLNLPPGADELLDQLKIEKK